MSIGTIQLNKSLFQIYGMSRNHKLICDKSQITSVYLKKKDKNIIL